MSDVGKPFVQALGKPDPEAPNGLRFTSSGLADLWKAMRREVRSGWFQDRFLYLFGDGLDALQPCLDAWSFVVPPNRDRMVVGRNAYGALLVLDNANSGKGSVHVLDPFRVVYWSNPNLGLMNLIAYWLPESRIPHFRDDGPYREWRKKHGVYLDDDVILAPRTPEGLGGKFELANLQEEPILEYYETTAPIYHKAFAQLGPPSPPAPAPKAPRARKQRKR
jgi:hypothetical protein